SHPFKIASAIVPSAHHCKERRLYGAAGREKLPCVTNYMEIQSMVTHSGDALPELYLILALPQEKRTVTDQIRDTAFSALFTQAPFTCSGQQH
ncbi:Uncharacterized protein DAT39_018608, partial [Clarias magur]